MDLKKLRELLKLVAESDVSEVEIEEEGMKVTVRKESPFVHVQPAGYYPPPPYYGVQPPGAAHPHVSAPATPVAAVPASTHGAQPAAPAGSAEKPGAANEYVVRAPIVGTYYQSPSPDSEAYVSVGSPVSEGTVLCIIEAMKLMNEIECEVSGTIKEVLVQNAEPVEYDQPLFVIEKA